MDGSRRFRSDVTRNAARERELLEQTLGTACVATSRRIDLAVRTLEIGVGYHSRSTVARPGYEDRVDVVGPDQPIHVHVHEIQPGRRPPVAKQSALYVVGAQWLAQERIGDQIDLTDGEIVRGPPVGIEQSFFLLRQLLCRFTSARDGSRCDVWYRAGLFRVRACSHRRVTIFIRVNIHTSRTRPPDRCCGWDQNRSPFASRA